MCSSRLYGLYYVVLSGDVRVFTRPDGHPGLRADHPTFHGSVHKVNPVFSHLSLVFMFLTDSKNKTVSPAAWHDIFTDEFSCRERLTEILSQDSPAAIRVVDK